MTGSSSVERLLAAIAPRYARAQLERTRPELAVAMRAWGGEWAAYARQVGVDCPSLVELADAMASVCVRVDDDHGWDLLTPDQARAERHRLGELCDAHPELERRAQMLPVFGRDGDLFLVSQDGRVHVFVRDDPEHDRVVATSFDQLLDTLADRARR